MIYKYMDDKLMSSVLTIDLAWVRIYTGQPDLMTNYAQA